MTMFNLTDKVTISPDDPEYWKTYRGKVFTVDSVCQHARERYLDGQKVIYRLADKYGNIIKGDWAEGDLAPYEPETFDSWSMGKYGETRPIRYRDSEAYQFIMIDRMVEYLDHKLGKLESKA